MSYLLTWLQMTSQFFVHFFHMYLLSFICMNCVLPATWNWWWGGASSGQFISIYGSSNLHWVVASFTRCDDYQWLPLGHSWFSYRYIFFTCFLLNLNYTIMKWWIFTSFFVLDGLVRRFIRDETGVHFDKPSPTYDQKSFVPIEVKAGSLVVIHGDLIHQRSIATLNSKYCFS